MSHLKVRLLTGTANAREVIYAAFRQCYHAGWVGEAVWDKLEKGEIDQETQEKLISRVMSSGHDSPLEHVQYTFAISGVSRALTHQLVRHRIASYSQQSQRYVQMAGAGFEYVMPPAIVANQEARDRFTDLMQEIGEAYTDILKFLGEAGKAEDARFVLPNAACTNIVTTMNVRALINFFGERCCQRAQWEIRAMAHAMFRLMKKELPIVFAGGGAKCQRSRMCPESEEFTCGMFPTQKTVLHRVQIMEVRELDKPMQQAKSA